MTKCIKTSYDLDIKIPIIRTISTDAFKEDIHNEYVSLCDGDNSILKVDTKYKDFICNKQLSVLKRQIVDARSGMSDAYATIDNSYKYLFKHVPGKGLICSTQCNIKKGTHLIRVIFSSSNNVSSVMRETLDVKINGVSSSMKMLYNSNTYQASVNFHKDCNFIHIEL